MSKLTAKQFSTQLNSVLTAVEKAQDRLQALAVDAAALVLAQGDYANDDKPRGDTSFGDMTRLKELLEGVQGRAKAVNASALAMWMTEFLPVEARIDMKTGAVSIKWLGKKAKEMSLQDARDCLSKCIETPFWVFRAQTETGGKPFDLTQLAAQMVAKALAAGVNADAIKAAIDVAVQSDEVIKKANKLKEKTANAVNADAPRAAAAV